MRINKQTIIWIIFILVAIKSMWFAKIGINLINDDGANYTNASRIIAGENIYVDFQSFFPPLNDYFNAFMISFLTENIFYLRIITTTISLLLFPILFRIGRLINLNYFFSLLAASFPFLSILRPDPLYIYSILFFGLLLIFYYLKSSNKYLLIFGGTVLAVGSLFRIDKAGVFILSSLSLILFKNFTETLYFKKFLYSSLLLVTPMTIIWLSVSVWAYQNNFLDLMISQIWTVPIAVTKVIHVNLLSPANLFNLSTNPMLINKTFEGWVYLGFVFTLILSSFYIYKNFKREIDNRLLVISGLFLVCLLSLPYIFGRMDVGHLIKGGMSYILLLGFINDETNSKIVKFFSVLYLFIIIAGFVSRSVWWYSFNDKLYDFGEKGSLYLNSEYYDNTTRASGDTIQKAAIFLKESDEKYVFAAPYMSTLYYLSDKRPPVIYDSMINKYILDSHGEQYVINRLSEFNIENIVYDRENGPEGESSAMKNYYPMIDTYIMENFEVIEETQEGWLFMLRK